MIFPTWCYHKELEACIVRSQAELDALGPGWADTPAAFEKNKVEEPKAEAKKPKAQKKKD